MPTNKKPRKPFSAQRHQVKHVMFALPHDQAIKLKLEPRAAFEAICRGDGDATKWGIVAVRINVFTSIVQHGETEWKWVSVRAAEAMAAVRERARLGKGYTLWKAEIDAVREALNACDDAQDQMTRVELCNAYQEAAQFSKRAQRAEAVYVPAFNALRTSVEGVTTA